MDQKTAKQIIEHLKKANASFEKGCSMFDKRDYSIIPKDKEEKIMACCKECSSNMNAAQALDAIYSGIYQHMGDGGIESDCRIAKNRWCFMKQDFAKARIKDLSSK